MSLPYNHVTLTNLSISRYREAKNNPSKEVHTAFLLLGVVMSLLFDHVTFINLYISSYREATWALYIHANTKVVINFWFHIFCDNKTANFTGKIYQNLANFAT